MKQLDRFRRESVYTFDALTLEDLGAVSVASGQPFHVIAGFLKAIGDVTMRWVPGEDRRRPGLTRRSRNPLRFTALGRTRIDVRAELDKLAGPIGLSTEQFGRILRGETLDVEPSATRDGAKY